MPDRLELPECTVVAREDGILHVHYKDIYLHLEDSKRVFQQTREFSPWEVAPMYLSSNTFTNQDKASREFHGSEEVMKHCSAIAMLSTSLGQRIMANFFIKIIRPSKPTRFFATEAEAIEWLRQFPSQLKE